MNNLVEKIQNILADDKNAVKTYTKYDKAVSVASEISAKWLEYNNSDHDIQAIIIFLPEMQRWTVIFNMTAWKLETGQGIYLGWFASHRFYSI